MTEQNQLTEPKQLIIPRDLYKVAERLANRGEIQGGGSSFYNEFVGVYEKDGIRERVSVTMFRSPGYDHISIYGAGFNGGISNDMWDSRASIEERYHVSGEMPENASEILSELQPDRQAMEELRERYRNGFARSPELRGEADQSQRNYAAEQGLKISPEIIAFLILISMVVTASRR